MAVFIRTNVFTGLINSCATLVAVFFLFVVLNILGCDEGHGLEITPITPAILSPSINTLTVSGGTISKATGGILKLSCKWTSSEKISTATAYLAYVASLSDPLSGPTGIISSGTSSATVSIRNGFLDTFQTPMPIPIGITSTALSGTWWVEIPFPSTDIQDAPEGKRQMLLWLEFNNNKTNTLAFEIEFTT